jgi:glycogen debranching enzyme
MLQPDGSTLGEVVDVARRRAAEVLLANCNPVGLRAAGTAYPEVWARDAVVSGLGLAVIGDVAALELLWQSLSTLRECQSRLGRIPNNVRAIGDGIEARLAADTMFAGAVDASLWFILGHYVLTEMDAHTDEVHRSWPHIMKAYRWLEYQDSNECGLLEVHESMDWADLFGNRYNSLFPNVLWFAANRVMARLAIKQGIDGTEFDRRADDIRFKINQLLWVGPEVTRDLAWIRENRAEWLYPVSLVDVVLAVRPYYLPYMAFHDYGDRFDAFGNLLAILFGLADEAQTKRILDYIVASGVDQPWPVKAYWPVVMPGDKDWRDYYRLYNLNYPYQYHNGGAWPFLGGFYVAALVKAGRLGIARTALSRLAEMNRAGIGEEDWEFNEWFHGQSGQPMGHARQTWSAGMFLYAHEAVTRKVCPLFTADRGW